MWKKIRIYGISILIPLLVGGLSALLTRDGMRAYAELRQPPLAPPGALFPIVWTVLYILMGIGAAMVYRSDSEGKNNALTVYAMQLVVNFFWSILFFNLGQFLIAFIWLLLLCALVIWMIVRFRRISPAAAYLQLPYLAWLLFAAYLNFAVFLLNR